MKNKKIKYFYINLDKDTKRKEHIENVFKKHKIPSERFSAIDGEIYKGINKGSRACRDTHLALWKKIKKDEIFIIFEDDITISENKFEEIISKLPTENWNILNFGKNKGHKGTYIKPFFIKGSVTKQEAYGINVGMWAYAINGEKIKEVLELFKNDKDNNDFIDIQLKTNFNKIKAYFYSGDIFVKHKYQFPSTRVAYDKESADWDNPGFTDFKDNLNINKDDSILLVGASKDLTKRKLGKIIDKYDVVIRINNGGNHELLNRSNRKILGTKTDIWVSLEPSGLKRNNPTLVKRYNKVIIGDPKQYNTHKEKYNNLLLMPPEINKNCKKTLNKFNNFPLHQEPTTGIKVLFYLIPHLFKQKHTIGHRSVIIPEEKICLGSVYNNITLIGFDGFKSGHWYGNKFIPNQDESDEYARKGLGRHNLKLEFEYIKYLENNGFIKFL
jgi:GR25 family glycosyltransferase involved in LPS biosynthesis